MIIVELLCKFHRKSVNIKQIRYFSQNHYEILKLKRNCTKKDIRNAFIELSKQHHPDKQKSTDSHSEFVRIAEAYRVLNDPITKADYDLNLRKSFDADSKPNPEYARNYYTYSTRRTWNDASYYKNVRRETDMEYSKKHFIKSLLACAMMVFGVYFYTLFVFFGEFYSRRDDFSAKNAEILERVRANANANGNDGQIRIMTFKTKND